MGLQISPVVASGGGGGGGGGTPGGSSSQLQYNNAGAFGGISGATTDGTDITIKNKILFEETGAGTDTITMQAPASIAASYTLTLPDTDGDAGQVLTTDGSGVTSWTTNGAGDVTGPSSSSDNAITKFNGTTGKIIQDSGVIMNDVVTAQTVGTAAVTLFTISPATNSSFTLDYYLRQTTSDFDGVAAATGHVAIVRGAGAPTAFVGAMTIARGGTLVSGNNPQVSISGNDVLVTIAGVSGETIDHKAYFTSIS